MTNQVDYTANGTSAVFPFPFAIETEADCQVLVSGVLQSGDYSIRGQGSIDGGAVVFDNPPAAGLTITLRRRSNILVSAADAETGYLADKLAAGNNISLTTDSDDGVLRVRIDAADVTAADVAATLKAGDNIELSTVTENGESLLRIAAKGVADQLEAGANITLTQVPTGLRIEAAQPDLSNVLYRNQSAVVEAGFWSKPVVLTVVGGIATPDPLAGTVFTLDVTATTTLAFPSGMAGKAGMFLVVAKQDAAGGHTLNLAPGYTLAGGEWSTSPYAINLLWITSDGSGTALDVVIAQRGV